MESSGATIVAPRAASTVLPLRARKSHLEVLMVRRSRESRFMGGARVFPGGAIEPSDRSGAVLEVVDWQGDPEELEWRAAAFRELAEEVGIVPSTPPIPASELADEFWGGLATRRARLDAGALRWVGHWVTPAGLPIRFDTRFYLLEVAGGDVTADLREVYDPVWVRPGEALANADSGDWHVEIPTRAHLEMLGGCSSVADALELADERPEVIEPRLRRDDGEMRVLLPGADGYEDAGG